MYHIHIDLGKMFTSQVTSLDAIKQYWFASILQMSAGRVCNPGLPHSCRQVWSRFRGWFGTYRSWWASQGVPNMKFCTACAIWCGQQWSCQITVCLWCPHLFFLNGFPTSSSVRGSPMELPIMVECFYFIVGALINFPLNYCRRCHIVNLHIRRVEVYWIMFIWF